MTGEGDRAALTEHERRILAAIEADIAGADPALARRLSTSRPVRPRRLMAGFTLWCLGIVVTLAALAFWIWLATAGLVLAAIGVGLVVDDLAYRLRRAAAPGRSATPR